MRTVDLNAIDHEMLVDLLCTATYGSEWLQIKTLKSERFMDEEVEQSVMDGWCCEDRWANRLLKGGKIVCYDWYDNDALEFEENRPTRHELTLDDIKRGLEKARDGKAVRDWADFVNENDDYFTCNNLMQVCIFGEVIYV